MYNDYLKDGLKIYTSESFQHFVESLDSRCYLMTDSGRFECVKQKFSSNYNEFNDYPVILIKTDAMRGYKAFNNNWTCRDKQYRIGEMFKEDIDMPIPCARGMHFCNKLVDVFYYYRYNFDLIKVAEVEAVGAITTVDGEKFCTNKMKIIREVYPEEILDFVRQSIYGKLITKLPSSVVADVMEKLRLEDERILKFHGIIREDCDKING